MDIVKLFSGGFPVTTKTFTFLQNAYIATIEALSKLGGTTYVLDGVVESAGNVSDGYIVYNNEVLPFRGGAFDTTVSIFEEIEQVEYNEDADNDGNLDFKDAYVTRYAKCGTGGVESFLFSELKRLTPLYNQSTPVGAIVMWSGAINAIPQGWVLCNGSNGTPNLQNKFIVGAGDEYSVAQAGGEKEVALTPAQLAPHKHSGSTDQGGGHTHTGRTTTGGSHRHTYSKGVPGRGYKTKVDDNPHGGYQSDTTGYGGSHSHSLNINSGGNHVHTFETNEVGSGEKHENRPPYFALAYIMFKGN